MSQAGAGNTNLLQDRLNQAVTLHLQGRLSDAATIYQDILRQQPNHVDALHLLGQLALQMRQTERGVALIRRTIELNPHSAAAHSNLGLGLFALNRLEEAIACFDKAIELKPDYVEAHNNRGGTLNSCRRYQEALASYDKAIALRPAYAEAYYNRGCTLCDLRRPEDGLVSFDNAIALKPDYVKAYYNRGNALYDLRRPEDALLSYDRAITLKPDYAEAHNNRATVLRDLRRYTDALVSCDKAIALNPNHAEAHNNRGIVLHALRRFAEALTSCDRAIALRPDYAEAHSNRGAVLRDLQRAEQALVSCDTAIALNPRYPDAHNTRGVTLCDLRRYAEALVSYDQAIALKPDYADAHANKSFLLLQLARFEQGWEEYEWRKKLDKPNADRHYSQRSWLGQQEISGQTLFIHWDQGLGDTLQFCRYVRLVSARGARVVMSVQEPLRRLLKQMEPAIQIIGAEETPAAFDRHCSLMSLPLAMSTTLETIPADLGYLAADAHLRAAWAERLPPRHEPRIGLVWHGSPIPNANRSIPLAALLPLLRDDVEWICLQKELTREDAALLRQDGRITFLGDDIQDFSDTAALVELMDLVITIDTSVAHLAGAMGKAVWILLPYNADWRWFLDRSDSPWYPTARLFRQQQIGNWNDVIIQVRQSLHLSLQANPRRPFA